MTDWTLHTVDATMYDDGYLDTLHGGRQHLARSPKGRIFGVDTHTGASFVGGLEIVAERDHVLIYILKGKDAGSLAGHVVLDGEWVWSDHYGMLRQIGVEGETGMRITDNQVIALGLRKLDA